MAMHSSEEAFKYIESFANLEKNTSVTSSEYKLERMSYMLNVMGHPEKTFKSVHIAGSKGKGSTATIAATMLASQGYKTGLYTSPHLTSYTERITLAGITFEEKVYMDCINSLEEKIISGELTGPYGMPTTFELLTLLAFLVFKQERCDWAVIEVGLGGRLDATNLIMPEVCIITPIELEHCEILGNTLEEIATEKAGIIKPGIPVVLQQQKSEAMAVFNKKASSQNSRLLNIRDFTSIYDLNTTNSGINFKLIIRNKLNLDIHTNLTGDFQVDNIASAILALDYVIKDFNYTNALNSLKNVKLEGRFEIINGNPPIVIDGSHTAFSIEKLCSSVKNMFGFGGVLIFGSVKGKNFKVMLDELASNFRAIIISEPQGLKETDIESVYRYAKENFREIPVLLEKSPEAALKKAISLELDGPVVITGSFYLAGAVKKILKRRTV